jgi:hypothetical protein
MSKRDEVAREKLFLHSKSVRFPALPDFLRSSGSGTEPTQPREYK